VNGCPHDYQVDLVVTVGQGVSHFIREIKWQLWMLRMKGRVVAFDVVGRLTNDFKVARGLSHQRYGLSTVTDEELLLSS
jgi:hypothetical protein